MGLGSKIVGYLLILSNRSPRGQDHDKAIIILQIVMLEAVQNGLALIL
jgi:hypothetical protein